MNKGDIIQVYKILHGSLKGVQWRDLFQMADTSWLRGQSLKLIEARSTQVCIQPKGSEHVE